MRATMASKRIALVMSGSRMVRRPIRFTALTLASLLPLDSRQHRVYGKVVAAMTLRHNVRGMSMTMMVRDGSVYGETARFDRARALTEDELRKYAPSVFATTAHDSRSERFQPIPTIE